MLPCTAPHQIAARYLSYNFFVTKYTNTNSSLHKIYCTWTAAPSPLLHTRQKQRFQKEVLLDATLPNDNQRQAE